MKTSTTPLASSLWRKLIYFEGGGTTEAESKGHQDDVNDHDHDHDHDNSVPPLPAHLTPLLSSTGRLDVKHVFSRSSSSAISDRKPALIWAPERATGSFPHMLRASTMEAVVDCLRPDGRGELIVVTDNWWYAKLILNTAAEVVRRRAAAASGGNITNLEQTPLDADPDLDPALSAFTHGGQRLVLYEGTPGPSVGHGGGSGEGGTSYFDRLWRTGAGRQSRTKQRFVVALRTTSKTTTTTTATTAAKQRTSARAQARGGGGGKKKRSAAKQAERNNRRLEAKRKKKQSWDEDDKSQR